MPKNSQPVAGNPKITAAHIRRGLRKHFPDGRCGIVFECAQGTGHQANRHLDALAMDLWPSHGLIIHGIEIKVDLYDWRRELKDPAKAEQLARFCDKFWIAAPPGTIPVNDLPHAWGLLEGGAEGMRIVKPAEKTPAQAVDKNLLAAVFRASGRSIDADDAALALAAALEKQNAVFEERVKERAERNNTQGGEDAQNWRDLMAALQGDTPEFRRHVHHYDAQKWIAVIRAVHAAGVMDGYNGLSGLIETVANFHKRLTEGAAIMNVEVGEERASLPRSIGKRRGKK